MRTYRHATAAERDARAERRRAAAEAAGIPPRTDDDRRQPLSIDLTGAGGPCLRLEPIPMRCAWRARDTGTGTIVARGALKAILHSIADAMPRPIGRRRLGE